MRRVEGRRLVVANGSGKAGDQVPQATYSDLYNATTSHFWLVTGSTAKYAAWFQAKRFLSPCKEMSLLDLLRLHQ